ncbi:MAG: hypothetical protein ACLFU1_03760 [Alphaproteobacteria bacterium]
MLLQIILIFADFGFFGLKFLALNHPVQQQIHQRIQPILQLGLLFLPLGDLAADKAALIFLNLA